MFYFSTMFRKVHLLFLLCLLAYYGYGQPDLGQAREFSIWWKYEMIEVNWKMEGRIQMEMNNGITSLLENKTAEAVASFNEVLKTDSVFWPAVYYRGVSYKVSRQFDLAQADFRRLLENRKYLPQAYMELSKVLILTKKVNEAEGILGILGKRFPEHLGANYLLGEFCLLTNNMEGARFYFTACEKIDDHFAPAKVKLGLVAMAEKVDPASALTYFDAALALDSLLMEAHWYRAMAMASQEPEKSLKDLNTLVRLMPANPVFYLQRARIYVALGRFDEAWPDIYKFIQRAQVSSDYFSGQQTSLDKHIDVQNAGFYLVRQLYGLRDKDQAVIKKAYCLLFAGHNLVAIRILNQASAKLSAMALWNYLCAVAYEHEGNHNRALEYYEKTLKLDPGIYDAHQKRGIYRTNLQDWSGARRDFTDMIRLYPDNRSGYKLRSVANYYLHDYREAVQDAQKALALDSSDYQVHETLGHSFMALGKYLPAVDEFKKCTSPELYKMDLSKVHQSVKELLVKSDTARAMYYLTYLTTQRPLYEEGTKLKIEILTRQKKWQELDAFLTNRSSVFVNLNTPQYREYIIRKKEEIHQLLESGK
jgi:tetratricopeptide (TPR) repeat protein